MSTPEKRITTSEIIRRMLERGGSEHSSVTLTRNAKGETQIEVIVRTGESGKIETAEEAELVAQAIYDRLAGRYPYIGGAQAS